MKKWYKYPEGYIENTVPWYVIIRRLTFLPFVFIFFAFLYLSILFGYGIEEAERFKKDLF